MGLEESGFELSELPFVALRAPVHFFWARAPWNRTRGARLASTMRSGVLEADEIGSSGVLEASGRENSKRAASKEYDGSIETLTSILMPDAI